MLETESTQPAWQHCGDLGCDPLVSKTESLRIDSQNALLPEAHGGMNFDDLKREINDFFDYTDLLSTLKEYYSAYQQYFDIRQNVDSVRVLMDDLERSKDHHLMIMQSLAYVALGSFCSGDALKDETKLIGSIVANNGPFCQSKVINRLFKYMFNCTRTLSTQDEVSHDKVLDTMLTVLYLSLVTYDHGRRGEDSLPFDNDVPALLMKLVAKVAPKKNLHLLLHKTLSLYLGQDTKSVKAQLRDFYGLPPVNSKGYVMKSRPEDLYDFYDEIKDKYTSFAPPINTDTHHVNDDLDTIEFPFQQLFQPNIPPSSTPKIAPVKDEPSTLEYKKEIEKKQSSTPFALGTPSAINEAGQLYSQYMYISNSEYQINQMKQPTSTIPEYPILRKIDQLYSSVISDLPNLVTVFLEQLVTMAPSPPALTDWSDSLNDHAHADNVRNREIMRSVISSILLLLLQWFKTSHVMKFEYLSQLLVDSGYLMLSTRAFMIEDLKSLYQTKTDVDNYSFFSQLPHMDFSTDGAFLSSACSTSSSFSLSYSWDPPASPSMESVDCVISERNKNWVVKTLSILQMLTKGKPIRSKILAQYKSWIPLKRIGKHYKDSNEELYALKLLKNQVQFLGLNWRADNMKTISSIARRCPVRLRDEWLIQCEDEMDDQAEYEATMRLLVNKYHGQYPVNTHNTPLDALVKDINHLFKQPLERLKLRKVEPVVEFDGWDAPAIMTENTKDKKVELDHSEDIDTEDEDEEVEAEEDPLKNIDWGTLTDDDLKARMELVEEQTVPRWLSSDINDTSNWKVLIDVGNALADSDSEEEEPAPVYEDDGDWA